VVEVVGGDEDLGDQCRVLGDEIVDLVEVGGGLVGRHQEGGGDGVDGGAGGEGLGLEQHVLRVDHRAACVDISVHPEGARLGFELGRFIVRGHCAGRDTLGVEVKQDQLAAVGQFLLAVFEHAPVGGLDLLLELIHVVDHAPDAAGFGLLGEGVDAGLDLGGIAGRRTGGEERNALLQRLGQRLAHRAQVVGRISHLDAERFLLLELQGPPGGGTGLGDFAEDVLVVVRFDQVVLHLQQQYLSYGRVISDCGVDDCGDLFEETVVAQSLEKIGSLFALQLQLEEDQVDADRVVQRLPRLVDGRGHNTAMVTAGKDPLHGAAGHCVGVEE